MSLFWNAELTSSLYFQITAPLKGVVNSAFQNNDIVVCRYADVLLMMAEAVNQVDGPSAAAPFVNQVRKRAVLPDLTSAATVDKAVFSDSLFRERTHEIFWEGLRHLDLVRFGKLTKATFDAAGKPNAILHELLPIPQFAIDASKGKLTQNAGY